jgi:hypothetical protein
MIIGLILAIVCGFIFKKIWVSIIVFYIVTGIHKSRLWLAIPIRYLPPVLRGQNLGTLIYGIFFWPIVLIACGEDPIKEYFRNVDKGHDRLY